MSEAGAGPEVPKDVPPAAAPAASHRRGMPSLTQLAARINPAQAQAASGPASNRPRLATSILARSSSTSSFGTAASGDSTAVNPSNTRPSSPTPVSSRTSTPPPVGTGATDTPPEGIPHAVVDKEEKILRGYKNIPTLDVITERLRLAKIRNASITEVPQVPKEAPPPPAPVPEEPAAEVSQPPAQAKAQEHPLQHRWTLYHDTKTKVPFTPFTGSSGEQTPFTQTSTESGAYEAGLTTVGEFSTVEGFCRYFNWIKPPSKLDKNSNYHLFKDGIKPMWEDPANSQGGKWVITMKNNPALLDRCWQWLVMALIGEELDERDEVCGAVVSLRSKIDRIQLWTRGKEDVEKINSLGKRLVKVLDVADEPGIGLEFQYNTDERPPANKFLSIQATYPQTAFGGSFGRGPNTASGGNFSPGGAGGYGHGHGQQQQQHAMTAGVGGTFNDGGFAGGAGWKPRKE